MRRFPLRAGHVPAAVLLLLGLAVWAAPARGQTYEELLKAGGQALEKREIHKAIEAYKKAAEVNPKGHEAHRELGRLYRFQEDRRNAQAHLRKALELAPEDGMTHFWIGLLYEGIPEFADQAVEHLTKAIGKVPPTETVQDTNLHALAYNTLGGLQMRRGNHGEARAAFAKAHQIAPTFLPPLQNLALHARRTGRFDEARTWYEKLLALRPNDAKLKETLELIKKKQRVHKVDIRLGQEHVQAGELYPADRIAFQGYDKLNRIVDFEKHWEVSSGLVLEKAEPLTIRAKDKASKEEYIYLTDKETGVFGKALVRVLGKPVRLAIAPEKAAAYPGSTATIKLQAQDEAGNSFPAAEPAFEIKQGEQAVAWKAEKVTVETWRIAIPEGAANAAYTVTARSGSLQAVSRLDVSTRAVGPGAIPWRADLAKAQAEAAKGAKPVLLYLWAFD